METSGTPRRRILGLGLAAPLSALVPAGTAAAVERASGATAGTRSAPAFRDPARSFTERATDLLGRLTREEKIALLHQEQPAIPRLDLASFRTGTEALHGLAWLGEATVFPQAIGLASTWDPTLLQRVGAAVGDEARGFQHERPQGWGLNLWAPVVNLLRDPRWGRNEEGYAEDPYLTGVLSVAYGQGLQGGHDRYLKTAPTIKHYLANNTEHERITSDSVLPERIRREYYEAAFRPALSADAVTGVMSSYNLVNGRPATVNPDLNAVVRRWATQELMHVTDADAPNNLVEAQGYHATRAQADAAALKAGIDSFTADSEDPTQTVEALTDAFAQGLIDDADLDAAVRHILQLRLRLGEFDPDGGPYGTIDKSVVDSPAHRALARETVGRAVVLLKNERGTLPLQAAETKKLAVLGPLADTVYTDWYSGTLPYAVTPRAGLAQRLGAAGEVSGGEGVDRITLRDAESGKYLSAGRGKNGAVLGVTAEQAGVTEEFDLFDWGGVVTLRSAGNDRYVGYDGEVFRNDREQPGGWYVQQQFVLEERDDGARLVRYAGYETLEDDFGPRRYLGTQADGTLTLVPQAQATRYRVATVRDGVAEAVAAARAADVAVLVVGSMPCVNGREDHDRSSLELAAGQSALVKAVREANPRTVVVLQTSYPDSIVWEQQHVPAMVWTSHAGQETGNGLADVLFGDVNPAARLTQTWYRSTEELPDPLAYDISRSERTYLYFRGEPLYPFGHGLSYTSFRYGTPRLSTRTLHDGETATLSVRVTNTGDRDGEEVVQLYTRQHGSRNKQPLQQLRAFARVSVPAGRSRTVRLRLPAADLAHWDVTRRREVLESGTYELRLGASAGDIRRRATLTVRGETIPPRALSHPTRAVDFDDYQGVRLVDETKASGTALGATGAGWVAFRDVELGDGAGEFVGRVAREEATAGRFQVRLDAPDGPLAATVEAPSTGDRYAYTTVRARLHGHVRSRHDVYLVFSDALRVSTFALR